MIRKGNDSQEPMVVYVSHKNTLDSWVCDQLNTGFTVFSDDESLIPFSYPTFKKMFYDWKISQTDRVKANFQKLRAEWK